MKNFKRVLSLALAALMVIGGLVIAPVDAKADTVTFTQVTDVNQLEEGKLYVIVAPTSQVAMTADVNGATNSYYLGGEVALSETMELSYAGTKEIAFKFEGTAAAAKFSADGKYVGDANPSANNLLNLATTSDKAGVWSIVETENDGYFNISSTVTPERYLCYNARNPRFATYKLSSNQQSELCIYEASGSTYVEEEIPTYSTPEEIVNAAYALEAGATLPGGPYTLTGIIKSVDSEYSSQYSNVTVTIVVGDLTEKPIQCFRLKGTGADVIGVGDEITVTGNLKNYVQNNVSTIEFDSGCTLDAYVDNPDPTPADIEVPDNATASEILALANTLVPGQSLVGDQTLTGVITSIDAEYSEQYKNISFTIQVGENEADTIKVFRAKGTGAETLKVGDTVTVSGKITNYGGTVEFDAGTAISDIIPATGDFSTTGIVVVLFVGAALVAVSVIGKRRMA